MAAACSATSSNRPRAEPDRTPRATDPDFVTSPATPRLRIGLVHAPSETDDQRDDMDCDACRIRITDGNGDALKKADGVATVAGSCGTADHDHDHNAGTPERQPPWNRWDPFPGAIHRPLPRNTTRPGTAVEFGSGMDAG